MVRAESGVKENQALIMSVENPVHGILFSACIFHLITFMQLDEELLK